MGWNKDFLFLGVIIFSIFLIAFTSAELLTSNEGVQYDSSIIERFNGNSVVRILVGIKDNSGISIEGTKEERNSLIAQKEEWYQNKVDEILANLSKEIDVISSSVTGFQGNITKKGFEMLLENSDISDITDMTGAPEVGGLENTQNETEIGQNTTQNSEQLKKDFSSLYFWIFGIILAIIIVLAIIFIKRKEQ